MMKRYDYSYYDGEFDGLEESEHGQWVPAKVAQALYDALNQITESFQGQQHLRGDHYSMAIEALSLADGEE